MALLPVINMLEQAGFISTQQSIKLADAYRDNNTAVFLDQRAGVIFLDPAFSGKSSDYYAEKAMPSSATPRNDMDHIDTTRRSSLLRPLIAGKRWLLQHGPESFKAFTLWSEHLVLHTRQSLAYVLEKAGWQVQYITAAQRYPVWNHLQWCLHNKPTGFNAASNDASSMALHQAYEHYLAQRDQTDTLIAVAKLERK